VGWVEVGLGGGGGGFFGWGGGGSVVWWFVGFFSRVGWGWGRFWGCCQGRSGVLFRLTSVSGGVGSGGHGKGQVNSRE